MYVGGRLSPKFKKYFQMRHSHSPVCTPNNHHVHTSKMHQLGKENETDSCSEQQRSVLGKLFFNSKIGRRASYLYRFPFSIC